VAVMVGCWVVLSDGAGQGACREVGSEGFEARPRAVADVGGPVGPIQMMPSLHYGGKEILGASGHNKVCAGGAVGKFSVLPGRSRMVPLEGVG
jgi:hypothetical protein